MKTLIEIIKTTQEVITIIGRFISNCFVRFIKIIINPSEFIASRPIDQPSELLSASLFGIFTSLINILVIVPVFRLLKINAGNSTFLAVTTLTRYVSLRYISFFLYGSWLHISAKAIRGKATFQSSVIAVLYMTAYYSFLLIIICFLMFCNPIGFQHLEFQHVIASTNYKLYYTIANSCILIYFIFFIYRLASVFRRIHNIGWVRVLLLLVFGIIGCICIDRFINFPIRFLLFKSFLKR